MKLVGFSIALLSLVVMFVCAVALMTLTVKLPELHGYVLGGGAGICVYHLGDWLMGRSVKQAARERAVTRSHES